MSLEDAEKDKIREKEKEQGSGTLTPRSSEIITRSATAAISNIKKPLTNLGKMFADMTADDQRQDNLKGPTAVSASTLQQLRPVGSEPTHIRSSSASIRNDPLQQSRVSSAAAEEAQAMTIQQNERGEARKVLQDMFPKLDQEIVDAIIEAKGGRIGACIDVCLDMSAEA